MSRDQSTTKALALGEKQQHLLPTLTESVVDGALRLWHDNLRSARTQENYGRTIGRFRQYLRDLGHDLDGDRRAVALAAEKFARAKQGFNPARPETMQRTSVQQGYGLG